MIEMGRKMNKKNEIDKSYDLKMGISHRVVEKEDMRWENISNWNH